MQGGHGRHKCGVYDELHAQQDKEQTEGEASSSKVLAGGASPLRPLVLVAVGRKEVGFNGER